MIMGYIHRMPLDVKIENLPDRTVVVTLSGSMTLGSSLKMVESQVRQALSDEVAHLVIDLSAVDFVDSAGLGVIVHTYGLMSEKGGTLRLCGVQPRVRSLLQMTRTESFLSIDAGREESLAALGE
jgi:anti-sigma B factor antagonist